MKKLICKIFGHHWLYLGTSYTIKARPFLREIVGRSLRSRLYPQDIDATPEPILEIKETIYQCSRCGEEISFTP